MNRSNDNLTRAYRQIVADGSEISVVMGFNRRTLSVSMVGTVIRPGIYEIFSNNTAFHALFKAGGITTNGTVRNIEVRRGGRIIQVFDMYDYLLGEDENPTYLQQNDQIFVPVQGKVVKIEGAVTRPMFYELREEEQLSDLIRFAGGLPYNARTDNLRLLRLENGREVLKDINWDEIRAGGGDVELERGDRIVIEEQTVVSYNLVDIKGAVKYPGPYEWKEGQRISDLIKVAGGLNEGAILKRAIVTRLSSLTEMDYLRISLEEALLLADSSHNIALQPFDQLIIFDEGGLCTESRSITITGHVRSPGTFKLSSALTLKGFTVHVRRTQKGCRPQQYSVGYLHDGRRCRSTAIESPGQPVGIDALLRTSPFAPR